MQSGCNIMDFLQEQPSFVRKSTKFKAKGGDEHGSPMQKREMSGCPSISLTKSKIHK
jgi:hypothetical protein